MKLPNREKPLSVICQLLVFATFSSSFQFRHNAVVLASRSPTHFDSSGETRARTLALSSQSSPHSSSPSITPGVQEDSPDTEKNAVYINGLLDNLSQVLDKYIINGSPTSKTSVYNLIEQIGRESLHDELVNQAKRMIKRAGLPLPETPNPEKLGKTDTAKRRQEVELRKKWEETRTSQAGGKVASPAGARSALSSRANSNKPDLFLKNTDPRLDPKSFSEDKDELEQALTEVNNRHDYLQEAQENIANSAAASKFSELVARAGSGEAFEGEKLGIGGLDDVLAQVKRRVWTPLAAPPQLLEELGIHPVRGLLLYGRPGCGKTLIARTIGQILSPARPLTVIAGPAIMDKFVGSSEKNLRDIFDNPPDIYDSLRIGERDGGEAIARAALHIIIMDEFDAIARTRGGRDGGASQGDAGVARDSMVNQLLTCLDGVQPPVVPTFVIGLTNKRSLIDPALLRPGRFEVQIEVPPPRTMKQRVSILSVHMKSMFLAGRILVRDAPPGTAAARYVQQHSDEGLLTFENFLEDLAKECEGMSGASLAGVARAAASHALGRVVDEYSSSVMKNEQSPTSMMDCLVIRDDFNKAIQDVNESSGIIDWQLNEDEVAE